MKSIRRSLTVYLLVLLAVALGAVSVVAYKSIETILETSKRARRELLYTQFQNGSRAEEFKLHRMLAMQAKYLARQTQYQLTRNRGLSLLPLNPLGKGMDANSGLLAPLWLGGLFPRGDLV